MTDAETERRIAELEDKVAKLTGGLLFTIGCLIQVGKSTKFPADTPFWGDLQVANDRVGLIINSGKEKKSE